VDVNAVNGDGDSSLFLAIKSSNAENHWNQEIIHALLKV
jgi:hypothetical protein